MIVRPYGCPALWLSDLMVVRSYEVGIFNRFQKSTAVENQYEGKILIKGAVNQGKPATPQEQTFAH